MVEGLGGFYWFFILTAAMGVPAVVLVWLLMRLSEPEPRAEPRAGRV